MSKSFRWIYTTDLHGHIEKYETVLKYAIEHKIKLLHIGADILPKGSGMLKKQKKFIKGYLKNFYGECERNGIKVLAFFGNDDIYTRKKYFLDYANLLDEVTYRKSGYTFKAYGYVPDHPFNLKNGTKLDRYGLKPEKLNPVYILLPFDGEMVRVPVPPKAFDSGPCISENGFYKIEDLAEHFKRKGTLENDLHSIKAGSKTVMAIHSPPAGLNLDVCGDKENKPGERVGSKAVLTWIRKKQPLLVLCGHIHENYEVTKSWKAHVGKTTVIQPGQSFVGKEGQKKKTTFVNIEITNGKVNTELIEI